MDLRTLTIMGFLCKVYVHLTLNGYQRLPIQITEFVNNHYIGWNLNISGITPNPKFMGFALMGAMPSMIMRCLGGPLWSLNLPALLRGILLAVYDFGKMGVQTKCQVWKAQDGHAQSHESLS